MRDRYAIPLVLFALLILIAVGAWYVSELMFVEPIEQDASVDLKASETDESSQLDQHLRTEVMRLTFDIEAVQQPDARWIAERLSENPTPEYLRELIKQRYLDIHTEEADRIQREFPDIYDRQRALQDQLGPTNGLPRIESAAAVAEELRKEKRFKSLLGFPIQPEELPQELRAEFFNRTASVHGAFKSVHEEGLPVYLYARPSELQEMADGLWRWYDASKVQLGRIRLYMQANEALKAASELEVMLGVYARTHAEASFLDALMFVVFNEQLVDVCLELADSVSITTERLESWLALGRAMQLDFMVAFALEAVDRQRLIGHGQAYQDIDVADWLDDKDSVEDFFSEERRWLEGPYALAEYASNPHPRLDTVQGQKDARQLDTRTEFLMRSNTSDAAKSTLRWTALELRVLERKIGSLQSNRDAVARVVGASGLLRPVWNSTTLEVWIDYDVFYGNPEPKPLFTLP